MADDDSTVDDSATPLDPALAMTDDTDPMSETEQAALLRAAREELKTTNADLAERLGVSLLTLRNWLHPTSSNAHREMPKTAKLLLGYILKEARREKRKKG